MLHWAYDCTTKFYIMSTLSLHHVFQPFSPSFFLYLSSSLFLSLSISPFLSLFISLFTFCRVEYTWALLNNLNNSLCRVAFLCIDKLFPPASQLFSHFSPYYYSIELFLYLYLSFKIDTKTSNLTSSQKLLVFRIISSFLLEYNHSSSFFSPSKLQSW